MLGQRRRQWYNIQSTERQVNVFTGPYKCVSISQTNIYLYKSTKAQWDFWLMNLNLKPNVDNAQSFNWKILGQAPFLPILDPPLDSNYQTFNSPQIFDSQLSQIFRMHV